MRTLKYVTLTLAAVLVAGGLFIYTAHAQQQQQGGFKPGRLLERIVKGLELTPDQIAKIKAELRAEKEVVAPMLQRLVEAKKGLRETVNRPGATEAEIRAAAAKVAAVEADLAVERAKISGKIRPLLNDEQIAKITLYQAKADEFAIQFLRTLGKHLEQ